VADLRDCPVCILLSSMLIMKPSSLHHLLRLLYFMDLSKIQFLWFIFPGQQQTQTG